MFPIEFPMCRLRPILIGLAAFVMFILVLDRQQEKANYRSGIRTFLIVSVAKSGR